ncbi:MAG: ectoine/hydroxyectoine ABC transporter substrate-binding protein EhuB [Gammaproteobacteria bacterium]|nr:ectoine/hydroxyectoine ABC transporter substrate-binding protein EhuB [Gammaproteobacteria bacterium]NIR82956.1 ectoine/hydroxyectoine ABC transporter substrate-binding protein EhuB [Gammaproteobacteria bacterium]NIR90321.1 ectoine/hydroxyectoine ABC transporter substrate-binding protein EhuB [Gammaproteobacteria bacterium]NIU04102.1 ectoine/hydroxyectoine ABC transporter substrate-binding protein EhuB [Gammaproteobacteria bacterium]NIV51398.1 ectoine/hydroxyectoine ABC transporter substrate
MRNSSAALLFRLVAVGVGLFTVCSGAQGQNALERIKDENVIKAAVANERPYGYVDENGRVTGESPEIARAILARIDPEIKLESVVMNWGELIPRLRHGDIDIITAGMFITPERCELVAFSNPTYVVGEAFLVKRGNPKEIFDYLSISRNRDTKVGLISGTVEYNYAVEVAIPAERALLYTSFDKAVQALRKGEIDAVGLTAATARSYAQRLDDPSIESTLEFFPAVDGKLEKGYGGFAFRKEDQELVDAFNEHLADFIGSKDHWSLLEKHDFFGGFGSMKPGKTAEELCEG